ncbi:MAG: hypothetical protein ZNDK_1126 [Candidatus Desulfovibrio kirbyi]|jgi:5-bromo-4-chloroindolyl phosphate hydrolysis protein|uniref:Uncharacterized protein n=1 Tax=Candidatus Desulfovibrio kirbyi TaxID=2696086 RepID=A0A6L2R738_9BACT|nr:MAG: hypothetical protein ZNDK_1126 [Candidatus Desulfovibrio kirbyi]
MDYNVNFLCFVFGSHEKAAESLGYTARHYRKIRKKIEDGEEIPQRIEKLLQTKVRELQLGGADHACR